MNYEFCVLPFFVLKILPAYVQYKYSFEHYALIS